MTRIDHSKRNKLALPKEFIAHQVFHKHAHYASGRKPTSNQKKNYSNQWNCKKPDPVAATSSNMYGGLLVHQDYQKELANLFLNEKVTHFVTLAFNQKVSLLVARKRLGGFFARLDRSLLGPRWKHKKGKRVFAIAFPENIKYNMHYHSVFRIAPEHVAKFEAIAEKHWRKLVASGDIDIQPIWGSIENITKYITKQASWEPVLDNMIVSTEFHPR